MSHEDETLFQKPLSENEKSILFANLLQDYDNKLDDVYSKFSEIKGESVNLVFGLEDIPVENRSWRVRQLELKLEEYTTRVFERWIEQEAENISEVKASRRYKRDILRTVLKRGTYNERAMFEAYGQTEGQVMIKNLSEISLIIMSYVKTGGRELHSGTGLPEVPSN